MADQIPAGGGAQDPLVTALGGPTDTSAAALGGSPANTATTQNTKQDLPESINTFGYLIMSVIGVVSCILVTK